MVSSFALKCSTVGHRIPICRRSKLLKICETSLRACVRRPTLHVRREEQAAIPNDAQRAHLELEPPDVLHEQLQQIIRVDLLRKLGNDFRLRLVFCATGEGT